MESPSIRRTAAADTFSVGYGIMGNLRGNFCTEVGVCEGSNMHRLIKRQRNKPLTITRRQSDEYVRIMT